MRAQARVKRLDGAWPVGVVALGSWGGENLLFADSRTFRVKTTRNFPTMGYAFNRSLWGMISDATRTHRLSNKGSQTDWCVHPECHQTFQPRIINIGGDYSAIQVILLWCQVMLRCCLLGVCRAISLSLLMGNLAKTDWAMRGFARRNIKMVQPTLSRAWHVGSRSAVGKMSLSYDKPLPVLGLLFSMEEGYPQIILHA